MLVFFTEKKSFTWITDKHAEESGLITLEKWKLQQAVRLVEHAKRYGVS